MKLSKHVAAVVAMTVASLAGVAKATFVTSTIGSNFNGTAIGSSSYIWFNSHLTSLSGPVGPLVLYARNQTVTFTVGATPIVVSIPDAEIHIQSGASASTTFGVPANTWVTTVPNSSGNPFLAGLGWHSPAGGIPGGTNPVTWSADFSSSVQGVSLSWQWSAAVYTNFSSSMGAVGATPIDGYNGASQSGTPANFEQYVTGGARGGGGSNFTGSNSATGSALNIPMIPAPSGVAIAFAGGALALRRRRN